MNLRKILLSIAGRIARAGSGAATFGGTASSTGEAAGAAPAFDGAHSRNYWETREETAPTAEIYWEGRTAPARRQLAAAVDSVAALSVGDGRRLANITILEVGCHAGPTLYAIGARRKWALLAGTELSSTVLGFAQKHLTEALPNQSFIFRNASADDLPFPDASFDIVVTHGCLVCIGPDTIEKSLAELLRVSRRFLVLGEPDAASAAGDKIDPYPKTSYWIRNYRDHLAGRAVLLWNEKISHPIGHMNEIAVFEKDILGAKNA